MHHRFRKRGFSLALGAIASASISALALGQAAPTTAPDGTSAPSTPAASEAAPKYENTLKIHGSLAVTFPTAYITRGVLLENEGFIAQPTAELDFTLFQKDDAKWLNNVTAIIGIWNSLHSHQEFAQHDRLSSWYEFDWYAGLGFNITPELNASVLYQEFTSPSGAFGTCKNIQGKLAYNDTNLWAKSAPWPGFSLSPYLILLGETNGKCGTGDQEGIYLETGIAPSYTIAPDSKFPVTLAVPLTVGLGFDHFYGSDQATGFATNETLGFVSAGLVASIPLTALQEAGYGAWKVSVGGYYYYLGDGVREFDGTVGAGGGGDNEWVGTAGFSVAF